MVDISGSKTKFSPAEIRERKNVFVVDMLFNRAKSVDFQPKVLLNGKLLDVVNFTKLLGVMISSDMKWNKNVEYISGRVRKKLWTLRRTKELGGTSEDLLMIYKLQIRCLTEIACPAWNGALTVKNIKDLERLQKISLRIILGSSYTSYDNSLKILKLQTLTERRKELCASFARKTSANPKFTKWFIKNTRFVKNSRQNRKVNQYHLPKARTSAYEKSPLFYLANLLNDEN